MNAQLISDTYLDAIEQAGYAIVENAIDETLINDLIADCYRINPHFHTAGIGRLNDQQIDKNVRKDKNFWRPWKR